MKCKMCGKTFGKFQQHFSSGKYNKRKIFFCTLECMDNYEKGQ